MTPSEDPCRTPLFPHLSSPSPLLMEPRTPLESLRRTPLLCTGTHPLRLWRREQFRLRLLPRRVNRHFLRRPPLPQHLRPEILSPRLLPTREHPLRGQLIPVQHPLLLRQLPHRTRRPPPVSRPSPTHRLPPRRRHRLLPTLLPQLRDRHSPMAPRNRSTVSRPFPHRSTPMRPPCREMPPHPHRCRRCALARSSPSSSRWSASSFLSSAFRAPSLD